MQALQLTTRPLMTIPARLKQSKFGKMLTWQFKLCSFSDPASPLERRAGLTALQQLSQFTGWAHPPLQAYLYIDGIPFQSPRKSRYTSHQAVMPTLSHLPSELLQCIVSSAALGDSGTDGVSPAGLREDRERAPHKSTVKSLSLTNRALRSFALPHLWRNMHISVAFDELPVTVCALNSFLIPSHPAREYSKHLDLYIDSIRYNPNPALLTSLDYLLAETIVGMKSLQSIRLHLKTVFDFPETLQAVLRIPELKSLTIASRGTLNLPAVQANKLQNLSIHSDVGDCCLDLSCFPILQELSLNMEDNSIHQSWDEIYFPPKMWVSVKSLSLHGFILDPDRLIANLAESLRSYGRNNALKSISYHLARDELDATYAWQMISQTTNLTSLSFTVPVLFDSRYAKRLVKAFPDLEELELFAFSRAAAWEWPDQFEAYIDAFSQLKNPKTIAINHNEQNAGPLPNTTVSQSSSFPVDPTLPVQSPAASLAATASNGSDEAIHSIDENFETDVIVVYGPVGTNFGPRSAPEDTEVQVNISRALFRAIPTLERVKFEPGLHERVSLDLFAYKISETLYERA